jgi:hypothetical protein
LDNLRRLGVSVDQRVIGHRVGGIRGLYHRHACLDEKREALIRLACFLMRLTGPPAMAVR